MAIRGDVTQTQAGGGGGLPSEQRSSPGKPRIAALTEQRWKPEPSCSSPCSTAWPRAWSPPTSKESSSCGIPPPPGSSAWARKTFPPANGINTTAFYLPDTVTPLPDEQNPLSRAIHGEVSTVEIFLRNPDLEEGVWIETSGGPLKRKDGTTQGGVVAFRDITKKKAGRTEDPQTQ